jgi:cytochrome c556
MLMMKRTVVLTGAALVAAILPALAAAPAGGPSAEQVIAARQAAFDMSAATFGGMAKAAKDGAAAKDLGFQAHGLAKWAHALPGLFPANSGSGNTKAKPEVWSDAAGFAKAAANYAAASDKLAQLSEANDTAGFTAQIGEVKKACDACHQDYRQR